jgi:superfamily I DNA/RNA helicase
MITNIRVVLSTVHSQKGEEFSTVVVTGLEGGNLLCGS